MLSGNGRLYRGRIKQKDHYHMNFLYAMRDLEVNFIPQGLLKMVTPTR